MEFLQHTNVNIDKPKRGRPRKEVKHEEIEDETVVNVKPMPRYSNIEYDIIPIDINNIVPNVINGVGVSVDYLTNTIVLTIEQDFKSTKLSTWKEGIGGLFHRDVKRNHYGKKVGDVYYIMSHKHSNEKFIIRLIEENDLIQANLNQYDDIILDNKHYAVLKEITNDSYISRYNSLSSNNIIFAATDFSDASDDDNNLESENTCDDECELTFYEDE